MKWLAVVAVCTLALNVALAQELPTSRCADATTDEALRAIAAEMKAAYNAAEPDRIAALYAPDATYLTQHFVSGIVHGRPAIRAYFKNGTDAKYKIETLDILATQCSGEFAYAITRYESNNAGVKAMGVNLVVARKVDGKWLIVAHESAVPDAANAIQKLETSSK